MLEALFMVIFSPVAYPRAGYRELDDFSWKQSQQGSEGI